MSDDKDTIKERPLNFKLSFKKKFKRFFLFLLTILDVARDISRLTPFLTIDYYYDYIQLILYILIMPIVLALIDQIGLLWRPLPIAIYAAILCTIPIVIFGFLLMDEDDNKELSEKIGPLRLFLMVLIFISIIISSFCLMSRQLYLSFGGFMPLTKDYWAWTRFGLAQLADNALFDMFTIYDWRISDIQATSLWSRTLVFLFNIELEFLIIATILHQFQLLRYTLRTKGNRQK